MRASKLLSPTLREVPAEAEIISHQLLLRAGFIRKSAAGVYTYLPLAQRVIDKIKRIVREEMNRKGGQEITLPIIQPAELWQESGRWNVYGDELFRLKDRHGRDFALGPTHEEIITDLARNEVHSYKQLPLLLYQIANKYRDERRPRFGLMRGREFVMKDLYSFDKDQEGLDKSYQDMYDAYTRVFTRCGLDFRPVEADSGAIGGSDTHEFMALADSGEAEIAYCTKCDYAANTEKAEAKILPIEKGELLPMEEVNTPNTGTIEEVSQFLGLKPQDTIKTLIFATEKGIVVAILRGDRNLNEVKLQKVADVIELNMASSEVVEALTGAKPGFAGPVGLKSGMEVNGQKVILVVADLEVANLTNPVAGANKDDFHIKNVNLGRDYEVDTLSDIRLVAEGDLCPHCEGDFQFARGIEVGQVFKLGTKYSEALNARFLDEQGKSLPMVMGCYGIGVTRTMSAVIEQKNDEFGIVWPMSIAPYHVVLVPVSEKDPQQVEVAENLYKELQASGIDVLLDDRKERPGVKFKDADLIGYPIRVTIGSKTLQEGKVEVKHRNEAESQLISVDEVVNYLIDEIYKQLS